MNFLARLLVHRDVLGPEFGILQSAQARIVVPQLSSAVDETLIRRRSRDDGLPCEGTRRVRLQTLQFFHVSAPARIVADLHQEAPCWAVW
jgi:hypothetical protein